jgi:hypothetical protein
VINVAQNGRQWRAIVIAGMNVPIISNAGYVFPTQYMTFHEIKDSTLCEVLCSRS